MNTVDSGCSVLVLQPIGYLTIDPLHPADGYVIEKDIKVGNNPAAARELAQQLVVPAGTLDLFQLANNPTFAYVYKSHAVGTMDEANADAYLRIFVVKIVFLMHALWLVKDNSANPLTAYLRLDDQSGPHFLSQGFTLQTYTADCHTRPVHFSRTEFDRAVEYFHQIQAIVPQKPENEEYLTGLEGSRLARTIYFAQAARTTNDLLIRIAFYCMCFESLFSTDMAGVAHRVSERVAVFLGKSGAERRAIYDDVHKLYGTRSTVVHGSEIKSSKVSGLVEVTVRGDDYLRRCLAKILADEALQELFAGKPEGISQHFVNELFPLEP